ncbi:hypothetical protein TIFTF001_023427 [Ficus carica]|uniref:RRM domain-containing protein n=1 Tax=Ficus carica TaxID=3494 RepID=A0AA88AKF0_FICCA|nr:hypothetical protein TIFTF001_023427 [Ficus carica]
MAFLSKVGNILRQSASKQITSEASTFKLPIFQAIRCMSSMSSSKLFIGGLSYQSDEQSLREAFAKYGEVVDDLEDLGLSPILRVKRQAVPSRLWMDSDNFASGLGGGDNFAGGVGGSGSFSGGYDGSSGSGFGGDDQLTGSSGNNDVGNTLGDDSKDGPLEETFRDDDDADFAKRA